MTQGNRRSISHRSDKHLGAILEESERRKEAEWQQKSRKVTWIVGIPIAALILWAAVFLIQYRIANPPVVEAKPAVAAAPVVPQDQKDLADFDAFKPNAVRVVKSKEPDSSSGKLVSDGDIRFAMELFNYVQPPAHAEPKPKK
ncbi:MAG: hypothetical protein ABIT37_16110 [Luteolibacter sp.]